MKTLLQKNSALKVVRTKRGVASKATPLGTFVAKPMPSHSQVAERFAKPRPNLFPDVVMEHILVARAVREADSNVP